MDCGIERLSSTDAGKSWDSRRGGLLLPRDENSIRRQESEMSVTNERQCGWLKNGNPPGDLSAIRRCGATNRRGMSCRAPAMHGKRRCQMHGGKSTGPKTAAGIQRIRQAHWKDGSRSVRLQREFQAWYSETFGVSTKGKAKPVGFCPSGPPGEWGEPEVAQPSANGFGCTPRNRTDSQAVMLNNELQSKGLADCLTVQGAPEVQNQRENAHDDTEETIPSSS